MSTEQKNIQHFVDSFLKEFQYIKGRSSKTIIAYRGDLTRIFLSMTITSCEQLSSDVLSDYISKRMQMGISKLAMRREIASLRSFCKFLLRKGEILIDPTKNFSPKIRQKKIPKTLSLQFMENFLSQKRPRKNESVHVQYRTIRNRCMKEILYCCGIRVGELVRISIQDIDTEGRWIKIFKGKGGKSRVIPYSMRVQTVLEKYLRIRDQYLAGCSISWLFPGQNKKIHLSERAVQHFFERVKGHITPHMVRHTTATHLLDHGGGIREIQSLLGHSSLKATQIYTSVSVERLRKVYSDVVNDSPGG